MLVTDADVGTFRGENAQVQELMVKRGIFTDGAEQTKKEREGLVADIYEIEVDAGTQNGELGVRLSAGLSGKDSIEAANAPGTTTKVMDC